MPGKKQQYMQIFRKGNKHIDENYRNYLNTAAPEMVANSPSTTLPIT
jgi:hypothetical protein